MPSCSTSSYHRPGRRADTDIRRNLIGLSLSGGGIRSATTGLGVLQALAELKILPLVDYLCTVSGGGYIGGSLSALLSLSSSGVPAQPVPRPPADPHVFRPGDEPAFTTSWAKFPFRSDFAGQAAQRATDLIAHLRTHGNFLIARRGLFKRDTMRAIGTIVTGIVYNVAGFVVVLLAAASLCLAVCRHSLFRGIETLLRPVPDDHERVRPSLGAPLVRRRRLDDAAPAGCLAC